MVTPSLSLCERKWACPVPCQGGLTGLKVQDQTPWFHYQRDLCYLSRDKGISLCQKNLGNTSSIWATTFKKYSCYIFLSKMDFLLLPKVGHVWATILHSQNTFHELFGNFGQWLAVIEFLQINSNKQRNFQGTLMSRENEQLFSESLWEKQTMSLAENSWKSKSLFLKFFAGH